MSTLIKTATVIGDILKGVNAISNLIKSTMGAKGRYVLIKTTDEETKATKDGVTVADAVHVTSDEYGIGVDLIQKAARNTVDKVGDGTTLSAVLTQSLLNSGYAKIKRGLNPILLKKELKIIINEVINFIKKASSEVKDENTLIKIATISSNNDENLGKLIGTALFKTGKFGDIKVEHSHDSATFLEYQKGYSIDRGFLSPNFINSHKTQDVRYSNAFVLILDKKVYVFDEIEEACQKAAEEKLPLVIIAHGFDNQVLRILELNNKEGFPFTAIQAQSMGEYRSNILKDIAILSGATVLPSIEDNNISRALGIFGNIHIKRNETIFYDGAGYDTDLETHINELKAIKQADVDYGTYGQISDRLSKLTNGVAILHVGSETFFELGETLDRVEDAVKATKAAIRGGYTIGGGVIFLRALQAIGTSKDKYRQAAIDMVKEMLKQPTYVILDNSGVDPLSNINKILKGTCNLTYKQKLFNSFRKNNCKKCSYNDECLNGEICVNGKCACAVDYIYSSTLFGDTLYNGFNYGFDVLRNEFGDLVQFGVIDPTEVAETALRSALSVSETFLTTSGVIHEEESTDQDTKRNWKFIK